MLPTARSGTSTICAPPRTRCCTPNNTSTTVRRVRLNGDSVAGAAAAFWFSRPSWYVAAGALEEQGLPGLLAARPGPRRAHKLTAEVLADVRAALAEDPSRRPADLVDRVAGRFGMRVHPRSIERALDRADQSKSR